MLVEERSIPEVENRNSPEVEDDGNSCWLMFFINDLSVEIDNSDDFETDIDSDNNTTSWNGVDLDDTELEELSSDIEDYKGNN